MKRIQLEHRSNTLFANSEKDFLAAQQAFVAAVTEKYQAGDCELAILMVKDMYLDAQSFLTEWKLDRFLRPELKEAFLARCRELLTQWKADAALRDADAEVKEIKACGMAELSRATLAGKMNVYWGHDKCDEIDYDMRRGTSFTTSNPGKVNQFRKDHPEAWSEMLAEVMQEKGLTSKQILSRMTLKVVAMMARHMRPIYEATDGQYGFSSIQVCPRDWDNPKAMEEEILFWYEAMKKEMGVDDPNLTFKVPATPAAVKAAAAVRTKYARLRVCATSNFSTRQHKEFYDALQGRDPAGLLVIVDVHLRTFSRPEFEAMGVPDPEKYCELLVSMIYRKCYRMLRERGLNLQLNGAGIRDAQGVRNNFTTDMALPVTLTIMPEVVRDFDAHPLPLEDAMHDEISKGELAILDQSKIFRQAYYEDEFPWDNIRSFPPYALMMDKFVEAYDECIAAIENK